MKLGLLTACFPDWTLDAVARWAAQAGISTLEIAAWPQENRSFTATHLALDAGGIEVAKKAAETLATCGVEPSCIAYYDNNLDPDPTARSRAHAHLLRCIEAAPALGATKVGTFIGRDPSKTLRENLREAEAIFPRFVERAGELGVSLLIENCPMEGWHPDGNVANLAYSPELWEWMFDLGLYLNYDPSHPVWLGIDPVFAIGPTRSASSTSTPRTSRSSPRPVAGRWFGRVVKRTIPGTSAGAAIASPAAVRSTGAASSTRSTSVATRAPSRSSMRTRCGWALTIASRRA